MGAYIVKVNNGTDTGTIENNIDIGFRYTDKLNSLNEAEIKLSGTGSVKRGLLVMGAEVAIYRNAVLEFKGLIDNFDTLDAGGMSIHVSGKEIRLVQEKGAYANSPWTSTASATINAAVIAESNYFSAGTVEAGVNIDFRLDKAQSLFNGLGNLANKTGQDIQIDYTNDEVDILDHRGSSTSVATLNDGIHLRNLRVSHGYPKGNWVKVYGKGDGENQIESDDAQGQDAGSQGTYGIIKEVIIDRSIISITEANARANIEVPKIKDPTKVYDFEVVNPNAVITTGDVLTLNSQDKDLTNEEVRTVGIERGVRGGVEYLSLQVTNAAFSQLLGTGNEQLGRIQKDNIDMATYMQGGTVLTAWGAGINAKTNYPLKVGFYVSPDFNDEAGNLQVNSLKLSYDIDKYNQQFGSASFSGSDPQVQNNSGGSDPGVYGDAGSNNAGVGGSTETDNPTVGSGSAGSNNAGVGGTSATQQPTNTAGVSVWAALTVPIQTYNNQALSHAEQNVVGGSSLYTSRFVGLYMNAEGATKGIDREMEYPSGTGVSSNYSLGNNAVIYYSSGETSSSNSSGYAKFWDSNYLCSLHGGTHENIYQHTHGWHSHSDGSYGAEYHDHANGTLRVTYHSHADGSLSAEYHTHSDGTLNVANHEHPDGSYDVNGADLDHLSIADGIGEAASVNASSVNIYLDFWNTGTSNWDNKHSILNTGATLGNDVDITDSGTYPDSTGWWRVRVEPITGTADFCQAKISMKYQLNS